MRILTKNIIEDNSSIVMTNADANYPVEALYSNMLEEITQASAGSTLITVGFAADQSVDSIFLGYHNASSITVVLLDQVDVILHTEVFSFPLQRARKYITLLTNVRKIEITINSSAGNVFIGGVMCGKYTQCNNISSPFNIDYLNTSVFEQTDGGQVLFREGLRLAAFNIVLNKNTDAQHDTFVAAYDQVLSGKTFWLDRNEDRELRLPMFGFFNGDLSTSEGNEFIDITTSFKEAR